HLHPRRAVEERALLYLHGHAAEEAHEEPGAEGDGEGRVAQDERPDGVVDVQRADELRKGDEEDRRRNEIGEEDGDADDPVAVELEPRQGIRRGQGDEHGEYYDG